MRNVFLALAFAVAVSPVAFGHHSFAAAYFEERSVTVEGSVVEFAYPHRTRGSTWT